MSDGRMRRFITDNDHPCAKHLAEVVLSLPDNVNDLRTIEAQIRDLVAAAAWAYLEARNIAAHALREFDAESASFSDRLELDRHQIHLEECRGRLEEARRFWALAGGPVEDPEGA